MRYFFLFILTLLAFDSFAQREVSGVIVCVFDEKEEILPGAFIREAKTDNATSADVDGKFHLFTLKDTCLVDISYLRCFTQTIRITQDTVIHVVLQEDIDYRDEPIIIGHTYWEYRGIYKIVSTGVTYDTENSMLGLTVNNGCDNLRLLPSGLPINRYVYQMNFQSNFQRDYMFSSSIGWLMYPYDWRFNRNHRSTSLMHFPTLVSAGYRQYFYPSKDFMHRDMYMSATGLHKYIELTLKMGYQTLNDYHNWGVSAGIQRAFPLRDWYPNGVSIGLTAGYYSDYYTYSLSLQGLMLRKRIIFKMALEKIDTHNFFNIGLNYFFPIR